MENNRDWSVAWGNLDVAVQKSLSVCESSSHPSGFSDRGQMFVPWSTLSDLRRFDPQLVISAEMGIRSLFAAWYCRRHGVPLVVWARLSSHSEKARGHFRLALRRWLVQRTALFITHGKSGGDYLRTLRVPDSKIAFAPYACGGGGFAGILLERSPEAARRWLVLGQLIERKGVIELLTAVAKITADGSYRPMEIWIAGTGPLESRIRGISMPASVRVRFLGNVAYDVLPTVMADCGILVYPTLADEWGMVVNEAMAGGLPVAGSVYSQAVLEMVEPGVNGFRFDPLDFYSVKGLCDSLQGCDEPALARMRAAARATAERWSPRWSAGRFADAVAALPGCRRFLPST